MFYTRRGFEANASSYITTHGMVRPYGHDSAQACCQRDCADLQKRFKTTDNGHG